MTADQRQALIDGTSVGGTTNSTSGGTLFIATNPTPGTAVAFAITTAFSATAGAFMVFKNNASAANGTVLYLDYIKLLTRQVPTSATNAQFAVVVDGVGSARYTSGGSAISPVNPNGNDTTGSQTQLWAGALTTAAASSSARLAARGTLRGVIPTVYDEYVIDFGGNTGGSAISAAASGRLVTNAPAILVGPQQFALLHLWYPSNTTDAPTYEFETSWVEAA